MINYSSFSLQIVVRWLWENMSVTPPNTICPSRLPHSNDLRVYYPDHITKFFHLSGVVVVFSWHYSDMAVACGVTVQLFGRVVQSSWLNAKEIPIHQKQYSGTTSHSLCTPLGRKSVKTLIFIKLQFPAQKKSYIIGLCKP